MSTPTTFPVSKQTFLIDGPAGKLEVLSTQPTKAHALTAVICHPHPLQEGTMHNKVVTTMAQAYEKMGLATVRFNYRGVGASEGEYGEIEGECADLRAIIAWVKQVLPHTQLCLAGFSFGSFIAASTAQDYSVQHLLSIAPAVTHANFTALRRPTCPWLVVQGEADEVVPAEEVCAWAETVEPALELIRLAGVGHFFHGQLVKLRELLITHIQPHVSC